VARIRVITHPRARLAGMRRNGSGAQRASEGAASAQKIQLFAIGASTGGPGAIVEGLRGLPAAFRLPILCVLHINEPFGAAFADWLDSQTPRRVTYARDGTAVGSVTGRVVVAPGGRHLVVRDGCIRLNDEAERHSCRPSVDVLFESVAAE